MSLEWKCEAPVGVANLANSLNSLAGAGFQIHAVTQTGQHNFTVIAFRERQPPEAK